MNPFQWLVDYSQKQPHWWGRQCCTLFAVSLVLAAALLMPIKLPVAFAVLTFINVMVFAVMFFYSRNATLFSVFADNGWAYGLRITGPFIDLLALFTVNSPSDAAHFVSGVMITCFSWFAACHPPKPPVRKPQLKAAV